MPFFTLGRKMKKREMSTIKKSTQKTVETDTRPVFGGGFFVGLLVVLR